VSKKYIDRGFTLKGLKDIMHPHLSTFLTKFRLSELPPFEPDIDSNALDW
jgi:hypothetical protein